MLESADAVLAVEPKRNQSQRIDIGILGPYAAGGDAAFEVRAFFSDAHGALIEDPVTGSLNDALGQWLVARGRVNDEYLAATDPRLGRNGRSQHEQDEDGRQEE